MLADIHSMWQASHALSIGVQGDRVLSGQSGRPF